jgi:3-oxoacyl-[acyl-carrier-protein] synthase III
LKLEQISYYLPPRTVTNSELKELNPSWPVDKVFGKTGIHSRRHADSSQLSSDLAVEAALRLPNVRGLELVDYVIFCSQTPDEILPTTACMIQDRLGLKTNIGAIDVNQGCSGYVYSLGLAYGLLKSDQVRKVLLLTGETYSKLMDPDDHGVGLLFGDAGSATIISKGHQSNSKLPFFNYGTDGSGAKSLICANRGFRRGDGGKNLQMNGYDVFTFTVSVIPDFIRHTLQMAQMKIDEIDLFVFHQANRMVIEQLAYNLGISEEKYVFNSEDVGNTVSSSIPLAMRRAMDDGLLRRNDNVMIVGFGVGLSWSAGIWSF